MPTPKILEYNVMVPRYEGPIEKVLLHVQQKLPKGYRGQSTDYNASPVLDVTTNQNVTVQLVQGAEVTLFCEGVTNTGGKVYSPSIHLTAGEEPATFLGTPWPRMQRKGDSRRVVDGDFAPNAGLSVTNPHLVVTPVDTVE